MAERKTPPIIPRTGWSAWLTVLAAAAMAFLALIALAGGVAAERLAGQWRGALEGAATVRIPGETDTLELRTRQVMAVLEATPGIASARPLTRDERMALLEPWLGRTGAFDALPVPQLIAVETEPPGPDVEALQGRLERASEGAVFDSHDAWRQRLAGAAGTLSRLAWTAAALVVLTATVMVALAARASVAAHAEVVRTLRVIGADDGFIRGAFTRRIALRAGLGALAGTALAVAAWWALPEIGIDHALKPALGPGLVGWVVLGFAVPAAAALVTWGVARQAVSRELGRIG